MQVITIALISVGLAADAFAVSLTSGLLIKRIKLNKALKIALFFGVFQAIMPLIGWVIGLGFRALIAAISHWVAFLLLAALGIKMIHEALSESDTEAFNPLDNYTLLGLAIATSIDALAAGFGLSLINVPLLIIVTSIGFVTWFLSFIGVFIGHYFGHLLQDKAQVMGGVILMGIGTYILLENMIPIS